MRRADKQIERLLKQRQNHARLLGNAKNKLDRAIARRKAADRRAAAAASRLADLKLTLARETRVRPNPAGTQQVDKPKLRKRIKQLKQQVKQLERKARQAEKKEAKVRKLKQSRVGKPTQARLEARKGERERSEDKLSSAIYAMTELSKDRAGRFGTASVARFAKPVAGKVSQRYGCTGYPTNPRAARQLPVANHGAGPDRCRVPARSDVVPARLRWRAPSHRRAAVHAKARRGRSRRRVPTLARLSRWC